MPDLYDELRALAQHMLGNERVGHTLDATALVNEAYLRLASSVGASFEDSVAFRGAVAVSLRRVLVDHARRHGRMKRGGDRARLTLATELLAETTLEVDILAVDDALTALEKEDARVAQVVEMRFFGGMSIEDVARRLDVGTATVERDWRFARAWLYAELCGDDPRLDQR